MNTNYVNPLWYQEKAVSFIGRLIWPYLPHDLPRFLYVGGLFYGIIGTLGVVSAYHFLQYHWFFALPSIIFTLFISYAILVVWSRACKTIEDEDSPKED